MQSALQNKEISFSDKQLLRLIWPLIVESFLALAVGLADSIMVANVGEAAVSGVSLVDSINVLIINAFTALGAGGAVVCGQFIGISGWPSYHAGSGFQNDCTAEILY